MVFSAFSSVSFSQLMEFIYALRKCMKSSNLYRPNVQAHVLGDWEKEHGETEKLIKVLSVPVAVV